MASCKKPTDFGFMVELAKTNKNKMIALEKKNRMFMNHIRCIQDSVNLFAWFMIPNEETEAFMAQLADFYGSIDFVGTKLQGEERDKKWYRAFRAVQQDFYEFIKANYPDILQWSGDHPNPDVYYPMALEDALDGATMVKAEET